MPTEATFLLAGLFVVAAASGWAFARFNLRPREESSVAPASAEYIRGLNLVLNRQTDEALELFVRMAEVDDETLETHFALGHLFRRRGEVDRAIRVHQNILARPSLTDVQKDQALFALGEDYLGAGLFDRAEQLFLQLTDSATYRQEALEHLLGIYERESEWQKAIDIRRQLENLTGTTDSDRIAHYYCELAEQARRRGDLEKARRFLKDSMRGRSRTMRGAMIRAAIAQKQGDYAQAVQLYEQVLERDSRLMAEVLPELNECYQQTKEPEGLDAFLARQLARDEGLAPTIAYAAILGNVIEGSTISRSVERFITTNDTLTSFLGPDSLSQGSSEERKATINRIAGGLRRLAMNTARYRCVSCGYATQQLIWHCPSCKSWESVRPVTAFQFDALVSGAG